MGTSQMVTKSWNAQPDGRPGRPRKGPGRAPESLGSLGGPRRAPEDPGKARKAREGPGRPGKARKPREGPEAPEGPEGPGRPRRAPEGPGRPRKASGRPGSPGGPRKAPEAPESPGKPRKGPGGPRRAPEGPGDPGKPRKAPESPGRAPGCKRPCPETGEALPGCLSGRRPACGGQAPGLPVHGLRRAGVPSLSDPAASGLRTGGGCGLAPVQGRLSASLKQVPGCLKGRCPATWVHERAEIAPNRAQRQRPAASGRSRGDCPRCRVKIQPQGAFFGA